MTIAATFRKRLSARALALAIVGIATSAALAAGAGSFLKPVKPGSVVIITAPSDTHHTPEPAPVDVPPSPPAPPAEVGKGELPAIASNFDVSSLLVPSWGTGAIPQTAKPDTVGAFRFICNASHLAKDDPIVYPGESGKSHLHQFFGNTKADAHSTYDSLRTSGDSTCGNMLNRSAYWMPAMLDGKGGVVVPDYVSVYYKRNPTNDPNCTRQGIACVPLPRGLRFVFGFNMTNPNESPTGASFFSCDGPTAGVGPFVDMVAAAAKCPMGNRLGAVIHAPECWNGKDLDSADHRSHVAYPSYGSWGYLKCPSTHPYVIPTFTMGVWYTTDQNLDRSGTWTTKTSTWHLSSDDMAGMPPMRPGSTFHSDWFGAWDDSVMKVWTENCVDKLLNCSGGDLGNGWQMKEREGFTWNANPRVVPIPS